MGAVDAEAFAAYAEAEPVFGLSDDILAGSLLCDRRERGHSDQRRRNYHSPPLQAHRLPLAIGSGAKSDRQPRLRLSTGCSVASTETHLSKGRQQSIAISMRRLFVTQLYEADVGDEKLLGELAHSIATLSRDDDAGRAGAAIADTKATPAMRRSTI